MLCQKCAAFVQNKKTCCNDSGYGQSAQSVVHGTKKPLLLNHVLTGKTTTCKLTKKSLIAVFTGYFGRRLKRQTPAGFHIETDIVVVGIAIYSVPVQALPFYIV